jgi:hypothetical protein
VDYLWHITLPVTAQLISAFATLTLLTKNSFLDEIKKQYVMTARAKGLSESRVLYGHVFRNAMLIVIAGFPGLFLGCSSAASLIETIFSLDGLGQLGFEAAVERDYPVIFGTLFAFGLIGLVVGILSDLMYVWSIRASTFESGRVMALSPLNQRRWRNFKANRRACGRCGCSGAVRPVAVCRAAGQRQAAAGALPGELHARSVVLPRDRPSAAISGPRRTIP